MQCQDKNNIFSCQNFHKMKSEILKTWYCLIAISILSVSCSEEQALPSKESAPAISLKVSYSGVDYIRGVIFAEGPVAQLLPSYIQNQLDQNSDLAAKKQEIVNSILADIENYAPDFVATFKTKITSQNPYEIREVLKEANLVFSEVLKENEYTKKLSQNLNGFDLEEFDLVDNEGLLNEQEAQRMYDYLLSNNMISNDSEVAALGWVLVAAVWVVAVAHAAIAVTGWVVAMVDFAVTFPDDSVYELITDPQSSELRFDDLILEISENL